MPLSGFNQGTSMIYLYRPLWHLLNVEWIREAQLKTPTVGTRDGTMGTQSKGRYIVRCETDSSTRY